MTEEQKSQRRDALAEIIERVAEEGLRGPRDLDVALDAIEQTFEVFGETE